MALKEILIASGAAHLPIIEVIGPGMSIIMAGSKLGFRVRWRFTQLFHTHDLPFVNDSLAHHKNDIFKRGNVFQWISRCGNDIG